MKNIAIVAVLLVVAGGVFWALSPREAAPSANVIEAAFTAADGTTISVVFDNDRDIAIMTGAGYEELVFERAISASGARYVNESEELVLWNSGDEITLYNADDEALFTGITTQAF